MRKAFITARDTAPYGGLEIHEGENFNIGAQKYAIYVDGANGVDLALYKDGAAFIPARRENLPPLAVGGDDNGKLRLKDFTAGAYRLTISGQDDINFTVGTTTPPPANEPILEEYIENGTHYAVRTASGTYKAPVTKV